MSKCVHLTVAVMQNAVGRSGLSISKARRSTIVTNFSAFSDVIKRPAKSHVISYLTMIYLTFGQL